MKKVLISLLVGISVIGMVGMVGCTEANTVSTNISKEADNFNVTRRLVVINGRTDTIIFSLVGNFSITVDQEENQLEVIAEVRDGVYRKHFIGLSDELMYFIEDVGETEVSKYDYEVEFIPEKVIPIRITDNE